ncbi:unnamed protein product [Closterium sp. Naga37s-1]|nr:unnamed protein product [Closterium sp. Naga37s-1]
MRVYIVPHSTFYMTSQTPFALQCWDDVDDVKREVHVLETLRGHPHVVSIIETIEDEKEVHIIMELCEGGELFDRILERKYYGERQAAKVIRSVVEVLDYCHQRGIVHRDLKPENILLVSKRSDTRCKVIDFGMAYCLKPGERCKLRAGTPNYIAPEVIAKNYGAEANRLRSLPASPTPLLSSFSPNSFLIPCRRALQTKGRNAQLHRPRSHSKELRSRGGRVERGGDPLRATLRVTPVLGGYHGGRVQEHLVAGAGF